MQQVKKIKNVIFGFILFPCQLSHICCSVHQWEHLWCTVTHVCVSPKNRKMLTRWLLWQPSQSPPGQRQNKMSDRFEEVYSHENRTELLILSGCVPDVFLQFTVNISSSGNFMIGAAGSCWWQQLPALQLDAELDRKPQWWFVCWKL